jgi:prolyl oligopeptidase
VSEFRYPQASRLDLTEDIGGHQVSDPYRWLEDLKDKEVDGWFKAQAEMTDSLLAKIPGRDALAQEWMALDKHQPATYTDIRYERGRVFYKKTLGGENVGKLFFREGWNGTEKLLFDPTPYKAGVTTTIQTIVPSFDGHYVAMGFSAGGAEYSELRILDVDRGTLLPESIYPSYGPIGWTLDGKGFFYDAGKVTDIKPGSYIGFSKSSYLFRRNSGSRNHHEGAAGGRGSLRSPDASLEPQNEGIHFRGTQRHPHH